jgi:dihydroorotase
MLQPHLFCKPIAKRPEDREALLNLALSWNKKVMFWSDSAPHPVHKKETKYCSAWVFTAPIALQCLAELFEKNWKLENLENFVSTNAIEIYWIKPEKKIITLLKKEFLVPEIYGEVVPFMNSKTISWSIIN